MLVKIEGKKGEERLVVSSRQVAEDFEKTSYSRFGQYQGNLLSRKIGSVIFLWNFLQGHKRKIEQRIFDKSWRIFAFGYGLYRWKSVEVEIKYINAFNEMENSLKKIYEERQQWEIERAKGILVRHILTDTIKNILPESPHKNFMYSNYTKLIYKVLFGKTAEELRAALKIQKSDSIRDNLNKDDLSEVENLERLTAGLINLGWGYEQIKNFLNENVPKKMEQIMGEKENGWI